ncbi:hypothetical protein P4H94_17110, partial [Paenibacillus macerans]|nr:hypothetical protein [Paenibacillus macerans]
DAATATAGADVAAFTAAGQDVAAAPATTVDAATTAVSLSVADPLPAAADTTLLIVLYQQNEDERPVFFHAPLAFQ